MTGAAGIDAAARAALLRKYRLLARWRRAKDRSFEEGAEGEKDDDHRATASHADGGTDVEEADAPAQPLPDVAPARQLPDDAPAQPLPDDAIMADRDSMRALAAEFPGALRELDRLGAVELERRVTLLSTGTGGSGDEPWMAWIVAYHALMRQVLADKRAGTSVRSPVGRASVDVLRALGETFGLPAEEIGAALFPPRRQG